MQKKVTVEMLVDVDRPDDNSILEDLEQELNCASHSIDIVDYKEALLVDGSEAAPPASDRRIVDIAPLLKELREEAGDYGEPCEVLTWGEAICDEIDDLESLPVIGPESLRPAARWIIMRRMADGARCKCEHCGREETFTTLDPHTQHLFCCRCGYKMEG